MREIPSTMNPEIVASIDARLSRVESDHSVTIPWAIESGSRAWGFPSPDSDYDCRFFYVRAMDSYLSLWPPRDVIETPLDKIYDVNGWDLSKALKLLVKGNATVTEWLRSPIVYRGDSPFRDRMLELAATIFDPALAGRHYLHVGEQQLEKYGASISLKRVFYALRPAATLRWIRENPGRGIPPMDLPTLVAECELPHELISHIADLVALKSVTREVGAGSVPALVLQFITNEIQLAHGTYDEGAPATRDSVALGEAFFLEVLREQQP